MPLTRQAYFHDEAAAAALLESIRWPQGAQCPACAERIRVRPLGGATTASGTFKCYACRRRFSVRSGTPLEGSHIPLSRWLRAIVLSACATRPVGCKHLEEASGVAPRIARLLRRKLATMLAGFSDTDPECSHLPVPDAGHDGWDGPEDEAFISICKAVGVPAGAGTGDFVRAVRIVLDHGRPASGSDLAVEIVREHGGGLAHHDAPEEGGQLALDRA